MKTLKQFQPLVVENLKKKAFHQPRHGQNYYEMIYIFEGSGFHDLNKERVAYTADDLFLISPGSSHDMEIIEETHFAVVKFTDAYLLEQQTSPSYAISSQIDMLSVSKCFEEHRLHMDPSSKVALRHIFSVLSASNSPVSRKNESFIYFQLISLLCLLLDRWVLHASESAHRLTKENLLAYIHANIYYPEKIRIRVLSQHFHLSGNYFSSYFKNHFEISYRQYIDSYKIMLIESRLRAGYSLKDIVEAFGFVDQSHLSHYYKKIKAINISDYKTSLGSTVG